MIQPLVWLTKQWEFGVGRYMAKGFEHLGEIIVSCECPPIPVRKFDYVAYFDGREEWIDGTGETPEEALADLLEKAADEVSDTGGVKRFPRGAHNPETAGSTPAPGTTIFEEAGPEG